MPMKSRKISEVNPGTGGRIGAVDGMTPAMRTIEDAMLYAAYQQMPAILVFTALAVVCFALLLWKFFPHDIASVWVGCMLVVTIVRWAIWRRFSHILPVGAGLAFWRRIFVVQSGVGGCAWGLGAALMLPDNAGAEMAVLVGGMLSVAAVSISSLASQQASLRLFSTGAIAPLAIAAWSHGEELHRMVALILLAGLTVILYVGRRSAESMRSLLASRLDATRDEANAAIRESEERYRTLVEWSPQPIGVIRDGYLMYVNPATVSLLGAMSADEIVGRALDRFIHPDFRELAATRRATIDQQPGRAAPMTEMKFLKVDGTEMVCESQGLSVTYDGLPAIQITLRDITERKRAEAELARSQQRLEQLVEGSGVGLWEWDFATNEVYYSPQWKRHLGFEEHEIASTFQIWEKHIHPDDLPRINRATADFRDGVLPKYVVEFRMRHRSGEWRWFLSHASVIKDGNGTPVRMVGSHVDITQRKRDEAAMRESEVRLELALRGADLGLWDWDPVTNNLTVNDRWMSMLGLDPQGVKPTLDDWHTHVHPEDVPKLDRAVGRLFGDQSAKDFEIEIRARHLDGQYRWISIKGAVASRDEKGAPTRIVGTHLDFTERKQAEELRQSLEAQLRESQKMQAIGTLAGGIAHDFNNIIAAILGNADLAQQDSSDPRVVESLAEIRRAGRRGRDLVQQILSFSRRQPIEKQRVNLSDVIDESARLLRATLPARLTLTTRCAPDVPALLADATQLEQVVINLASNSMHAIPSGTGTIEIRLETVMLNAQMAQQPSVKGALAKLFERGPGPVVRLSVIDSGAGMSVEVLNRIFEPFFTTKPIDEGTGLGLSVVLGIVESHDGAIAVNSVEGRGTTFSVYLPIQSNLPARERLAPGTTGPRVAIQKPIAVPKKEILYLDDDEAMVFLVARLLGRRGFAVKAFSQQSEALEALKENPASFGLVVTDFNMPGMSGIDVALQVKQIRADLPVAIASGFIDQTLRDRAEEIGVADLIFKANVADDFCAAIGRLAQETG